MDPNQRHMTDSVLNLTMEIMYLLTGEDYTIVKKATGKPVTPANQSHGSGGWRRSHSPITAHSAFSPSHRENDRKVLELANRIIYFLTGEVWQYLLGHNNLVKGVLIGDHNSSTTEEPNNTYTWEELAPSSTISTPSGHKETKNEPASLDGDVHTSTPLEHIQDASSHIKLETVSSDEDHLTYMGIHSSSNPVDRASDFIKEENALREEGDVTFNRLASASDNLEETSNTQIIDQNSSFLTTHPDLEDSLTFVESRTTCIPFVTPESQIPDSDSGICFSDTSFITSAHESHVPSNRFPCSKCSKCFSTQVSLLHHKIIHSGVGKKDGYYAEAGSSTKPSEYRCKGKSPVWTRGGKEIKTSMKNRTQGPSSGNIKQKMPVQDGGGKKTKTNLKNTHSQGPSGKTGHFNTSDLCEPWNFKKAPSVEFGEVFPFKSQLVLHQKNNLSKPQFSCSECGKCVTSNSHLIVHQRVHTGEKPFGCSMCPKRFATKSTLVIHQRVHTREKPYSCTECRKCFPCNSQLVIHQRIHTGEKPYSCLECGKGFISNSDLLRHRRVHTGERPFKCTECPKCFSQKSHLREHQKTHRR